MLNITSNDSIITFITNYTHFLSKGVAASLLFLAQKIYGFACSIYSFGRGWYYTC